MRFHRWGCRIGRTLIVWVDMSTCPCQPCLRVSRVKS